MSAAVFLQLEDLLQAKGKLSKWEEELFIPIKRALIADFFKGMLVSSSVVWPALRAFPMASRLSLSIFAGVMGGRWYGRRAIDAGIDKFLGLQGTRIQAELASLILREYKDEKSLLMLMRKHFYLEQVFGDVNPDVPRFRWRPRNTYVDSTSSLNHTQVDRVELYQKIHKYKMTTENSKATLQSDNSENNGQPVQHNTIARINTLTTESQNWDLFVDPLESVFGYIEDGNETKPKRQSEKTDVLSKRQVRALKKAHRRQRSNHAGLP